MKTAEQFMDELAKTDGGWLDIIKQRDAEIYASAIKDAAELVRAKCHSPECQDKWSITRTMAFGEAATEILALTP